MAYNLEKETLLNQYYRVVLYTTKYQQLVIMSVDDEIEREIHPNNDQFIRIEKGKVKVILNDIDEYILSDGDSITIPNNTYHHVINLLDTPIKLYTIYSPPHHPPYAIQRFKPEK